MNNIKIQTQQFNEQLDVLELATLTIELWKKIRPETNATIEGMSNWIKNLDFDEAPFIIRAYREVTLVGWILLFIHDSKRLEINPWALGGHPFIHPKETRKQELAQLLIQECINYASETKHTRIELCYEKMDSIENYPVDPSIYPSSHLLEEDEIVLMSLNLVDQELPVVDFPEGIEVCPLKEVDYDKLYACFYDSFCESGDRNFLSETAEERQEFFAGHYNKEEGMITKASIALVKGNNVIGFVLVRPTHNEGIGHLWIIGVIPEYRGHHLGSLLLKHTIKILKEQEYTVLNLAVDDINEAALRLYEKYNFVKGWRRVTHVWKEDQ